MHKIYKFDDIVINVRTKKKPEDSDKLHYIGLEHIEPGVFEFSRWGSDITPKGEKLIMKKGDVLFGKRRAYQKKVAIAPFDGIFSAHGMVLRPKEDVICKEYFPFFISSNQFMDTAMRISVGGLSPTINWKDLQRQEFELPPIEEQRVLADKLWSAYNLKESYKKMIIATDALVKAQFVEMFGNPNRNEKKWHQYRIADLFILQMGKTPDRSVSDYWDGGNNNWISISDMSDNYMYITDTKECITDKAIAESGIKIVPKSTIIMSFKLTIGRVLITNKDIYTNEAIMAFIKKDVADVSQRWVFQLLSQYNWMENASQAAKGKTLNKDIIGRSMIYVPPMTLQLEFDKIHKQAEKSKQELTKAINKIDRVIKSLLQ